LFTFSVIYPGEYCFAEFSGNTRLDQQQTVVKITPPFVTAAKITVHGFILPYASYGQVKPLWAGGFDFSGFHFSSVCRALFLQSKPALIYKLQFARKLLFPFHFFW
jgi:hypothetical protein